MFDLKHEIFVLNLIAADFHLCFIFVWVVLYRDEVADSLYSKPGVGRVMILLYKMEKSFLRIKTLIKSEELHKYREQSGDGQRGGGLGSWEKGVKG